MGNVSLTELLKFKQVSPTKFPQSHDKHMTQTVSNMAPTISFDIRNHGKNIQPRDIFD